MTRDVHQGADVLFFPLLFSTESEEGKEENLLLCCSIC